jgi:hypothetical protein
MARIIGTTRVSVRPEQQFGLRPKRLAGGGVPVPANVVDTVPNGALLPPGTPSRRRLAVPLSFARSSTGVTWGHDAGVVAVDDRLLAREDPAHA